MNIAPAGLFDQIRKVFALVDRRKRWLLVLLAVATVIVSTLEVISVAAIFPLLNFLLDSNKSAQFQWLQPYLQGQSTERLVMLGFLALLGVYLVKVSLSIFTVWLKWLIQSQLYRDISVGLLSTYLATPIAFHLRHNAAELQRNINPYVAQTTQFGCLGVIDLASDLLLAVGIFIALSWIEPVVSALALLSLGITSALYIGIGQGYFLTWSRRFKVASAKMLQLASEALIGIKTIKVLGREEYFVAQYRDSVSQYCDTLRRNSVMTAVPRQILELAAVGALVAIISWAVLSGKDPKATIPILAVFAAAAFRLMPAFIRFSSTIQNLRFGHDAIETVYNDLTRLGGIEARRPVRAPAKGAAGEIVLRDASFTYAGASRPALEGVSLTVRAGEAVALVGTSGAGKTTLADLILGLHRLSAGTLTIDGVEYRDPAEIPRGVFGYVPQDPFLVDDTILRNIALGIPDAEIDQGRVDSALKAAALDQFVQSLPGGLQTVVGERGVRLSGGQRQRIGIARALYVDPEFLVLDEATSSIDVTTEAEITEAINRLRRVKTVIVVAHRLSTVRECDRIIFLKDGLIVDEGNYDELVRKNAEFAAMVRQLENPQSARAIVNP